MKGIEAAITFIPESEGGRDQPVPKWLSDPYDQRAQLYNAGMILLSNEMFISGAGIFGELLSIEPECALAWYNISSSLFAIAKIRQNPMILRHALACATKAQFYNNKYAVELIKMMESNPLYSVGIGRDFSEEETSIENIIYKIGFNKSILKDDVASLSNEKDRMGVLMLLSELDEDFAAELLINSLDDPDDHVKMSALKRIDPSWQSRDDLRKKLEHLASPKEREKIMPYILFPFYGIAESGGDFSEWAKVLIEEIEEETGFSLKPENEGQDIAAPTIITENEKAGTNRINPFLLIMFIWLMLSVVRNCDDYIKNEFSIDKLSPPALEEKIEGKDHGSN